MAEDNRPDDDRLLCYCKGVRYGQVRRDILLLNAKRVEQVTAYDTAGGGCRTCHPEIQTLIDEHRAKRGLGGLSGFLKRMFVRS